MTTHAIPAELAGILEEIIPPSGGPAGARSGHRDAPGGPGGAFRHRQHIHLAFIAVRRYGTTQAVDKTSAWIRHLTAHAPQKYNATVTRAWTEIVGYHVAADPSVTDFEVFAEQNPALLDKRLLARHYTAAALASPQARADWLEPDVADFPWSFGGGAASASLAPGYRRIDTMCPLAIHWRRCAAAWLGPLLPPSVALPAVGTALTCGISGCIAAEIPGRGP